MIFQDIMYLENESIIYQEIKEAIFEEMKCMVTTKADAWDMINTMTEFEFSELCIFLNITLESLKRKKAEARFVSEIKAAEESVAKGNYVTSEEMHKFLGV